MLAKAVNLAVAFFTLNKGAKANAKSVVDEAIDIGLAITKIAKNKKVDEKTKDALLQEVKEFDKAVIKFLDALVIPD